MNAIQTTRPSPGLVPESPPTSMVQGAFPCRTCSYNLHGLDESGRCPECGTPVGLSLRGDLLRFSKPEWLQTLRSGVNLILYGILILIFGSVFASIVGTLFLRQFLPSMLRLTLFTGALIVLIGSWKLTTPDPSGLGEDQYGTSRKLIRIGLGLSLVGHVINAIRPQLSFSLVVLQLTELISLLIQLFSCVSTFAELNYLSKLAIRFPDDPLCSRARFLMYAIGLSQCAVVVFREMARWGVNVRGVAGKPGFHFFVAFEGVIAICLFIFYLMFLSLLTKFGKRFKDAAESASAVWQSAPVSPGISPVADA